MSFSDRPIARLCKVCGQFHSPTDSHLYDYHQPIDDDLTCQICLQPLVDPVDTKCGHTFCARCIKNYLKLQNTCPNDRNPLSAVDLQSAPVIIRRYAPTTLIYCLLVSQSIEQWIVLSFSWQRKKLSFNPSLLFKSFDLSWIIAPLHSPILICFLSWVNLKQNIWQCLLSLLKQTAKLLQKFL